MEKDIGTLHVKMKLIFHIFAKQRCRITSLLEGKIDNQLAIIAVKFIEGHANRTYNVTLDELKIDNQLAIIAVKFIEGHIVCSVCVYKHLSSESF